jgi:replicative DNA helicase
MGLPKFESVVDGIQRSTYSVLAGGTGSGKTTFALYAYVYRPLVDNMAKGEGRKRVKIIYYSLEMSAEIILAKLLSLHIFETYGVELSFKQIISKQDVLSKEHYDLIIASEWWLEEISKDLFIWDKPISSDGLYASLMRYSENHGTWTHTDNTETYTANDPEEIIEIIIDHMGLLRKVKGRTKKEEIDTASQYLVWFRNKCGYSPLALLQLNRTSSSMDRRNGGFQEIQLDDIKDTGGPSEDAELVIAIFNPWREKVRTHNEYPIHQLKDKYRAIQVLKNRLGEADKSVSVNFHGSIGMWREFDVLGAAMSMYTELQLAPYKWLLPIQVEATASTEVKPAGFRYAF